MYIYIYIYMYMVVSIFRGKHYNIWLVSTDGGGRSGRKMITTLHKPIKRDNASSTCLVGGRALEITKRDHFIQAALHSSTRER